MKKNAFLLFLIITSIKSFAQENQDTTTTLSRETALNVYIDCGYCDMTYFRQNFTLINYVRDRKVADVHIIVSSMTNGGGGREYMFQFYGQGKYSHLKDTLKMNTKADATSDEIRKQHLKIIKTGLAPYILKTPFADKVSVVYASEKKDIKEKDPWNNWVFSLSGHMWLNGQKTSKIMNAYSSASASRITEKIKHQTSVNFSYSENNFRLYDSNDSLIYSADSYTRSFSADHSTIWSLGEHWGAGIEGGVRQSTYSNLDFGAVITPAIEYNVFKYSDASRKQLRFGYHVGAMFRDYHDTTVFDKTEEFLMEQQLEVNFKYITNWGSIRTGLYWENYLHDFSLYNISTNVSMSIRLFKGLSFNIFGYLGMPRNQISLVKTESTPEDVILRQRELATKYSYYTSIGLSYTFGSIYNNVVNPRLD
jgi:hypothetical protein